MKTNMLIALAVVCTAFAAHAGTPSDQSVSDLLDASRMDKTIDQMMTQMDVGMKNSMQQSLRGRNLTSEQQAAANKLANDMSGIMKEEISMAKLKPIYLQVYKETFSQEEINGLLAFYRSPIGKTFVEKLPLTMQRAGALMQERMGPVMQKLSTMQNEFMRDLNKAAQPTSP
jgi:hypothetical protein